VNSKPAIAGFKVGGLIGESSRAKVYSAQSDSPSRVAHRLVGESPSGRVFSGERLADGEACVIKIFDPDGVTAESIARFTEVRRVAARCRGAGIVDFVASSTDGRSPFVAMMGAPGESLEALLKRERVRATEACEIAGLICARLAALHEGGIVHGSLRPSNVLIRRTPQGRREVVLVDVGAYLLEAPDIGGTVVYVDTASVNYMAPEQLSGGEGPTAAADLYALGVILFEAIAGVCPFQGSQIERVRDRLHGAAPRLRTMDSRVSASLDKLVSSLLSREPRGRPNSASLLGATLLKLAGVHGADADEDDAETAAWVQPPLGSQVSPATVDVGHTVVTGGGAPGKKTETVALGQTVLPVGESGQITIVPGDIGPQFIGIGDGPVAHDTAAGGDTGATVIVGHGLVESDASRPLPMPSSRMEKGVLLLREWFGGPWPLQKKLLVVNVSCLVVVLFGLIIILGSR